MKILVTGAAGFVGFHLCKRLLDTKRCEVVGVDNLSDYYDVGLKEARLAQLEGAEGYRFVRMDFGDAEKFSGLMKFVKPDYVAHLGAQAGVRHSMDNPAAYVHSNITGLLSVLEACRQHRPKQLVMASSSSVYGNSGVAPFSEDQRTDAPASFYAATKQAGERMAYSYAHVFGMPITALRFFTVYGPWGRPDMTPIIFAKAILEGKPLKLFNEGKNLRDFTYIDDIVDGVVRSLLYPPAERPTPPFRAYNIGHNRPIEMTLFVQMLEAALGRKAIVELAPPQPGDMVATSADLTRIHDELGYHPRTSLEEGLKKFVAWYREYYGAAE